jgi:hypothetical protein
VLLVCLLAAGIAPGVSPLQAQGEQINSILLPLVARESPLRSPFGFHVGPLADDGALDLAGAAEPGLARVGDVLWSEAEPVPGEPYRVEQLAAVEQRIAAVRARGMEPIITVQWSPDWARLYPQSECGPIKPEYYGAFAAFVGALAQRYKDGPLAVRYFEIWNEPDFFRDAVQPLGGFGCWAEPDQPFSGGGNFGALLKEAYAAIKVANPQALVVSGSLSHLFDGAQYNDFLEGMLASGAGDAFDLLGFHAYGDWSTSDLLVRKTLFARQLLARYGYPFKPLLLTEIAALCLNDSSCISGPSDALRQEQANDTVRLNAEVVALGLAGAIWYTLADAPPGFAQSQLISVAAGQHQVHPSYYAFRNSALLLRDAQSSETQPRELPQAEWAQVQVLRFEKPTSTLYVLWVQRTSKLVRYDLPVPSGAQAICHERLYLPTPAQSNCSDADHNGRITRQVGEAPQYIEVAR